ncbi:MAG TPA: carbohydrate ABC transporter permease [Jatrophihabitans sp.]|nr:carbohydrate ABC transporter permease [Jatrophihabitans sp.]
MSRGASYAALIFMTLVSLLPLMWVLNSSVRTEADIDAHPLGVTWPPHWSNYREAWTQARFSSYFLNSVVVAVATVGVVLLCTIPAAYAIAVVRVRYSRAVFYVILLGLMIPVWSIVIPLFYEMRSLGLINTRSGAVLIEAAVGLPFAVFMLRAALRDLPRDVVEAAVIDGAGHLRMLRSVVVPLCMPTIKALIVFEFMWSWNELVVPLFFLQTDSVRTLPIGLSFFQGRFGADPAIVAAGTSMAVLPVLAVYLALNRQFIDGITAGASK